MEKCTNEAMELASKISKIVKESPTYIEYVKAVEYLQNKPEILEKVKELKIKHVEYANERQKGNDNFEKEKYISQEFYKLMLDKNVDIYFMNEEKLVKLFSQIYIKVAEQCKLNIFV